MAVCIFFDTETTGIAPEDRIIQYGAIITEKNSEIKRYYGLCRCDVPIKPEAIQFHNITQDMIESQLLLTQTDFYRKINEFNSPENYLIAHNISFDLKMLAKEGFVNRYTRIDTLRCARHLLPDIQSHGLQNLRNSLSLCSREQEKSSGHKAHDALSDTLILKLLFAKLEEIVRDKYPQKNLLQTFADLSAKPVLLKLFRFGKYKGREIRQIAKEDIGYLRWMYRTLELDEDLNYTLNFYIN